MTPRERDQRAAEKMVEMFIQVVIIAGVSFVLTLTSLWV
jgi:hypothetical protein